MKKTHIISLFALALAGNVLSASAQRPIIQTKYTADPAPMVHNDTVFLYTTHDEDDAQGFKMMDWLLYTSTDMVNWTDHGPVASLKSFKWVTKDNGAWAEQCIERDGKFYMYCPIHGGGIGVLVSDSPYGPFVDPIGKPLVWQSWDDIDPSVMIDDDGQAYMYWGNPDVYYVKLNKDMISYSGEIVKVDSKPKNYQEGPWIYKREGRYYLAYASTCCPEGLGYAMSDSPTGPWKYMGMVMDSTPRTRGNHPGIIDYKGKSYVFGLNYDLLKTTTSDFYERRSVSVAEMEYAPDGSIITVPYWLDNTMNQIETFNPYRRIEAETIAWSKGVKARGNNTEGVYITSIHDGDYVQIKGVDLQRGARRFKVSASTDGKGGTIEVRLGDWDGMLLGTCTIDSSNGNGRWTEFSTKLFKVKGVHDISLVFRGGDGELFDMDCWSLEK